MKTYLKSVNRGLLALITAALFSTMMSRFAHSASAPEQLRIGYQKYGTLIILKARGALEKRLAPLNIEVKWTEFPAGPQLLEGLNVGSIDYGTVGEAPPIFAQAAGANLVYSANEPPAPSAEAIVVPNRSSIKSVTELKGRKVALNKGSNVHYLLVKALEKNGVAYKDIEPVFLTPADARAAFESGSVDAWVIWDPFLAAAEKQIGARVLADGKGIVSNHQFYLSSRAYAERRPDVVKIVVEEIAKIDDWGKKNPKEVAAFLAPQIGLDIPTTELAVSRLAFGVQPISDAVIAAQQKIGDVFYDLKLIPKSINVRDATLSPRRAAAEPLQQLRIGFQKNAVNLALIKQRGVLEQRFKDAKVSWIEFPAGPQLLEALSVGSLDFGLTGDTPPVFAQAAGTELYYVGAEPPKPDSSAILLPQNSPIKNLKDLNGKKIALQKGSSSHYLLVRAVEKAGLQWSDIQPIYLAPADARAAFENGSVDAWAIWDPYYAATELAIKPRVLTNGRGLSGNNSFYLASRSFAEKHPEAIAVLFDELTKADAYAQTNRKEAVQLIADFSGLDVPTVSLFISRRPRSPVGPLKADTIADQQRVADAFFGLGLIPRKVTVADIVWQPARTGVVQAAR